MKDIKDAMTVMSKELATTDEIADKDLPAVVEKIKLSRAERSALNLFMATDKTELNLYPLDTILEKYLEGFESPELLKLFPMTSLGGITYLKIKYGWAQLRQDFLADLQYKAKLQAVQTKFATISFLSSIVNSFIKKNEAGLYKYILSGGEDSSGLPARFKIQNFEKLARYVNLIGKIADIPTEPEPAPPQPVQQIAIKTDNVTIGSSKKDMKELSSGAKNLLTSMYNTQKDEEVKK